MHVDRRRDVRRHGAVGHAAVAAAVGERPDDVEPGHGLRDAHALDRDGRLARVGDPERGHAERRPTMAAYDPLCALHASGGPWSVPGTSAPATTAAIGITKAASDLQDPHAEPCNAHARDVRGSRKILSAHATRLRALARCGKPPNAQMDRGPGRGGRDPSAGARAPLRAAAGMGGRVAPRVPLGRSLTSPVPDEPLAR